MDKKKRNRFRNLRETVARLELYPPKPRYRNKKKVRRARVELAREYMAGGTK